MKNLKKLSNLDFKNNGERQQKISNGSEFSNNLLNLATVSPEK